MASTAGTESIANTRSTSSIAITANEEGRPGAAGPSLGPLRNPLGWTWAGCRPSSFLQQPQRGHQQQRAEDVLDPMRIAPAALSRKDEYPAHNDGAHDSQQSAFRWSPALSRRSGTSAERRRDYRCSGRARSGSRRQIQARSDGLNMADPNAETRGEHQQK